MKCEEIRSKLNAYLDGELKDMDTVRRHLDQCEQCRHELAELSSVNDFLSQYEEEPVPQVAIARILAIPQGKIARSLGWFARLSIALTAAAAFFLGVVMSGDMASRSATQYTDITLGTETLYSFDMGGGK